MGFGFPLSGVDLMGGMGCPFGAGSSPFLSTTSLASTSTVVDLGSVPYFVKDFSRLSYISQ